MPASLGAVSHIPVTLPSGREALLGKSFRQGLPTVIMPHSTRRRIALGLRKLRTKRLENPWKKHDNIPL